MFDLSVVIPTRNRVETAQIVINGILQMTTDINIQVVVVDNSDNNQLKNYLDLNNVNLVYSYIGENISFSENFQRGLHYTTGEYVCYIGDDDYISSSIGNLIKYMNEHHILSVSIQPCVSYYWDSVGRKGNIFQISNQNWEIKEINVPIAVKKLLKNGGMGYLNQGLPKIYHGIIHKSILAKIKKENIILFDSLSPDICSSYILSKYISKNYVCNFPFTIPGSSKKSASGSNINKKHIGLLKDAPHFRGWVNYQWNKSIPAFYSVETIWGESLQYMIDKLDDKCSINYNKLCEICYINHPEYSKEVLKTIEKKNIPLRWKFIKFISECKKLIRRIVYRIGIILRMNDYLVFKDIENITYIDDLLLVKCKEFSLFK